MRKDDNNGPLCGDTARTLGVRYGDPNRFDIEVTDNEMVKPNTGGMSVSPDRADNLPRFRRKDPIWIINSDVLSEFGLQYRPDPENDKHGFIEPDKEMKLSVYLEALSSTQAYWRLYNDRIK